MTEFNIDVCVSEAQFLRFSFFDAFIRPRRWVSLALFAGIFGVFSGICFTRPNGRLLGVVLLLIGLGLPLVYLFSYLRTVRRQARHAGLDKGRSLYRAILTAAPDGICAQAPGAAELRYQWATCTDAYRTRDCIYLYVLPSRAILLPAGYVTGGTLDELWQLIGQQLPPEKLHTR